EKAHSGAVLALEDARVRGKAGREKIDSRDLFVIERAGETSVVQPRRADVFERRRGAASDREIGELDQSYARIEQRLGETAHVRRGVDPGQTGLVEAHFRRPALDLDDGEVGPDFALGVKQSGEFAGGQAVLYGDFVK